MQPWRSSGRSTARGRDRLSSIAQRFGITCIVARQVYSPAADEGYYVRLRPLPAGQHHLSIRGTNADGFSADVFYTLNVVRAATR